jgi:hypothetical protein
MFRDKSEELERLQAELLAEEESEQEAPEQPQEEELFEDYEDTRPAQEPVGYQNYSNGYRAYNTDDSDEDLDSYSEEVRAGGKKRGGGCLVAIALFLAIILVALVAFWFGVDRGYIKWPL